MMADPWLGCDGVGDGPSQTFTGMTPA